MNTEEELIRLECLKIASKHCNNINLELLFAADSLFNYIKNGLSDVKFVEGRNAIIEK